ncbi:MAG: hypothetical protein DRP02_05835 [Candidatus Gerdarchaeota archaeon]|nr:MAG: hypothetical protein DRO63_06510 [Candidatus Gerdarchaeota archaeon]RLI71092.1 MAG: hypothetical protein DRP02_05835 [Candidatus Gerdarchaeota archaeon]
MSEKLALELEEFLMPYALERTDISNSPLGGFIKAMMGPYAKRYKEFMTWQVRAFVRVLLNADRDLTLEQISNVIFSEAYTMMGYTFVRNLYIAEDSRQTLASNMVLLRAEIHNWFLFLEEKGKLIGNYNRFLGIYSPSKF